MWTTPYSVVYEDEAVKLLEFRGGKEPILIVPPQAGHHSFIADYEEGQSLVQSAMNETDSAVYSIEWKSCTIDRKYEGIEHLLDQVDRCVNCIPERPYLVGLCQGGWLSTIYAALNPSMISSKGLTLAGAPIDTHAGESSLHSFTKMPLAWFQGLVWMGGGLMRGDMMLMGWKNFNPMTHYVERYTNPNPGTERFYEWYDLTQDLSGTWYLWVIENLFQKNLLGKNKLVVGGTEVDLTEIPGHIKVVVGTKDDITPREQTEAILKYCDGEVHEIEAGHVGVFMSRKGIKGAWSNIFSELFKKVEVA